MKSVNCKRGYRATLLQFTDFMEFQEIVIGKRIYSSINPFAVQLPISQYFGAINPFAVSARFSINPFAVEATQYDQIF